MAMLKRSFAAANPMNLSTWEKLRGAPMEIDSDLEEEIMGTDLPKKTKAEPVKA